MSCLSYECETVLQQVIHIMYAVLLVGLQMQIWRRRETWKLYQTSLMNLVVI